MRRGSGGRGALAGGDGVIRELEMLADLEVSILSERRERAPFGLSAASLEARGRNLIAGREVSGRATVTVAPGDRVVIETPGGGALGSA